MIEYYKHSALLALKVETVDSSGSKFAHSLSNLSNTQHSTHIAPDVRIGAIGVG
jgi:hypothetical protein